MESGPDTLQHHSPSDSVDPDAWTRRVAPAAAGDVAVVLAFVLLGRNNHNEGLSLASILGVAAPFLIAFAVSWVATLALTRRVGDRRALGPARTMRRVWPAGVALWVGTAVGGLALRNLAFGDGTATSFVIVACLVLGAGMLGWRAAAALWASHRR